MRASTTARSRPYPVALVGVLVTVGMLFTAFTAALLMRRAGSDWQPVQLPDVLWQNTLVLILSSVAVEVGRARLRGGQPASAERWLGIASLLGVAFLAGQTLAWGQLAGQGVFLPSGPHAAFFYMLSAVHGAHVIGGIGALGWGMRRAGRGELAGAPKDGLFPVAAYWHFVGFVWLFLLAALTTL